MSEFSLISEYLLSEDMPPLNEQFIDNDSLRQLENLKLENERLNTENKKAKKIIKELIEQLNRIHYNLFNHKQMNLEKERKDAETIKKLHISNNQLNEKIIKLEAENAMLKEFTNEFVNKAKSIDKTDKTDKITKETNKDIVNEESNNNVTINNNSSENESIDSNKKQKKKGSKKFNFPSKAVDYLIESYKLNKFPDNSEIKTIANEIKLTPQQVNKWFRDRRHKLEETKVNSLLQKISK
jgi:hypothetical protein